MLSKLYRSLKPGAAVLAAVAMLATALPAGFAQEKTGQDTTGDSYVYVEGTDTQHELIAYSKSIIEADALYFKDLNGNGELDTYEDWREDADTRTADLISKMTVREKIAQMQHPTFTPKDDGTYPNYLQKWNETENIGFVLVREFNMADSVGTAATTMNQLQKWCESSEMGIPVVVSMDSVHGASYVNGATVTGHNLSLAATRDEDIVTQLADIQRQELMAIGVRMLERLNEEIRRRTRVVGIFPNPGSYLRLVTTFLMEYAEDWSVSRAYLSEESIRTLLPQAA